MNMNIEYAQNNDLIPNGSVLLSAADAARYLNLGETKTRELMTKYRTKFVVQVGRRKYVHKDLLDKWLLAQVIKK